MEASRAATGMLEVLATRAVLFMMDSVTPSISTESSGKSLNTFRAETKKHIYTTQITSIIQ